MSFPSAATPALTVADHWQLSKSLGQLELLFRVDYPSCILACHAGSYHSAGSSSQHLAGPSNHWDLDPAACEGRCAWRDYRSHVRYFALLSLLEPTDRLAPSRLGGLLRERLGRPGQTIAGQSGPGACSSTSEEGGGGPGKPGFWKTHGNPDLSASAYAQPRSLEFMCHFRGVKIAFGGRQVVDLPLG